MAELIARARRFEVPTGGVIRPFEALAESIAYQQLSGKAAATIWGRVRALYPHRKILDPKLVLETPDENMPGTNWWRHYGLELPDRALEKIYRANALKVLNWQPLE